MKNEVTAAGLKQVLGGSRQVTASIHRERKFEQRLEKSKEFNLDIRGRK